MKLKKPLYHVTAVDRVPSILRDGLKGGVNPRHRGEQIKKPSIFVLTTDRIEVTHLLATQQIWPFEDVNEYAVIRIDPAGVTGRVLKDNVEESIAGFHRIIQQAVIKPAALEHIGNRRPNFPGAKLFKIQQKLIRREKLSPEELELAGRYMPGILALHAAIAEASDREQDIGGRSSGGETAEPQSAHRRKGGRKNP